MCDSGFTAKVSQMPVVLVPIHFDRSGGSHQPSCQHSAVIRPFITADFMTGIAAMPGKHIPEEVRDSTNTLIYLKAISGVHLGKM